MIYEEFRHFIRGLGRELSAIALSEMHGNLRGISWAFMGNPDAIIAIPADDYVDGKLIELLRKETEKYLVQTVDSQVEWELIVRHGNGIGEGLRIELRFTEKQYDAGEVCNFELPNGGGLCNRPEVAHKNGKAGNHSFRHNHNAGHV